MNENISTKLNSLYEEKSAFFLQRRTYTIIKVKISNFNILRERCESNVMVFSETMQSTTIWLLNRLCNVSFAFFNADEIIILLSDFDDTDSTFLFKGNIQQIVSHSASVATEVFNRLFPIMTLFKSRTFNIADDYDIESFFISKQIQTKDKSLDKNNELGNIVVFDEEKEEWISKVAQNFEENRKILYDLIPKRERTNLIM